MPEREPTPGKKKKRGTPEQPKNRPKTASPAEPPEVSLTKVTGNRIAAALIAATGLAGAYHFFSNTPDTHPAPAQHINPPAPAPSTPESNKSQEQLTDEIIKKAEEGLAKLEKTVNAGIDKHISDPDLQNMVRLPFKVAQDNSANPKKNAVRFQRMVESGQTSPVMPRNYFNYRAELQKDFHVAGFNQGSRTISLAPEFDQNNTLDTLLLYHEIMHARTDEEIRNTEDRAGKMLYYMNFIQSDPGTPKMVISDEVRSFIVEMEAANIITGGKLKADAVKGKETDPLELLHLLHGQPNQAELAKVITHLAKHYFPHGTSGGDVSRNFTDAVTNLYIATGHSIYDFTAQGNFIRLR